MFNLIESGIQLSSSPTHHDSLILASKSLETISYQQKYIKYTALGTRVLSQ